MPRLITQVGHLLDRLASSQHRFAGRWVALAFAAALAALPLLGQLGLDTAWRALLPDDAPSSRDLDELEDRVGGLSTLMIGIESSAHDVESMQRFADDLVPRLEALEGVESVDWNVGAYERFVWEHRHLYAQQEDLREVRDSLEERLNHEKAQANPFYVDLEDEEPPEPGEVVARIANKAEADQDELERFPDGYLVHPDRDLLALFVRSDLSGGDAGGAHGLLARVQDEAAALGPAGYGAGLEVQYGGDVVVSLEEHEAIAFEMGLATIVTVFGVFVVLFVFFRRWRAIPLLGASLSVPVILTFAIGELFVDHLNTATAFLGSIVVGNGINPNIIWLSRYFEERRRQRDVRAAITAAHRNTWVATLTASLAAAIAYGSLVTTDFRGFRDFGIIGGIGMVLCWSGSLLVLPALTALTERVRPLFFAPRAQVAKGIYGVLFARIASAIPKPVTVVSLTLGVAAVGIVGYAVANDPLEYDFRNLKSEREGSTAAHALQSRIRDMGISSTERGNGIAVYVPERQWVPDFEQRLEARGSETGLWKTVRSLDDFLPDEQGEKVALLQDIRKYGLELRSYAEPSEQQKIDEHLPPPDVEPLTAAALPEAVARPFSERDGTRGRLLLVEEADGRSIWDGRYLVQWAEQLRGEELPNGKPAALAGRAPVFADMIRAVWHDGPQAIVLSFLATLVLVLLTFRELRERALTMLALLLGIAWMGATMALIGMKLNFLNFVAFPITFGNGVDYGVNVMRRYALEERKGNPEAVRAAVEQTGGAVILCSLTTIIGYSSLYLSANLAVNSFGGAMAISEVTCVLAAVLTVPAVLLLWRKRQRKKTSAAAATAPAE